MPEPMFTNLSNYFDDDSRAAIKEGVAAWRQLKKHEDWNHWLNVGHAIAAVQDIAASVTNSSSGRHFNAFMAQAYKMPSYLGEFADMNKAVRSLAAKCWRNREAIEKWRAAIGQDKALRVNHPATVWAAYEAAQRPPTERAGAASPFAQLKQETARLQGVIDRLKKDADADGSVSFTLRDSAADIAATIISSLGDTRAEEVATAIRRKRGKKS